MLAEWQVRTLASVMAFLPQSPEAVKALAKAVDKISIFKTEEDEKQNNNAPSIAHLENPDAVSVPEPQRGSAEQLMRMFGRPGPRPGR